MVGLDSPLVGVGVGSFLIRDFIYVYTWMVPDQIPGNARPRTPGSDSIPSPTRFRLGSAPLRSLSGDDWRGSPTQPSRPPVALDRVPLDTSDRPDPLDWGRVAVFPFCLRAATMPMTDS